MQVFKRLQFILSN